MRDIVKVIDAIIAEIPKDEPAHEGIVSAFSTIKDRAIISPTELLSKHWEQLEDELLARLDIYAEPQYYQNIRDIWQGKRAI